MCIKKYSYVYEFSWAMIELSKSLACDVTKIF